MAREVGPQVVNYVALGAYDRWLAAQDAPIYRDYDVADLRTLERGWWSLRGCPAAILNLAASPP